MFFFRRKLHTAGPLELLRPEEGFTTGPLQRYVMDDSGEVAPTEPVPASEEVHTTAGGPDYSRPKPVIFSWKPLQNAVGRIRYSLHLSRDPEFGDPVVMKGISQPFMAMRNLFVGAQYYWKVVAEGSRIHPVESEVWTFSTHPAMPRWVFVPGITNMRDLGGWLANGGKDRIRQGVVYRSSAMRSRRVQREAADILINELRIRTDLDLRTKKEHATPVLDETQVRWCHAPVPAYGDFATDAGRPMYREAMRVFTDRSNYPILCHCRAGADRVGTVVVLLLGLLGVGVEDLALDYELTSLSVWGRRSRESGPFQAIIEGLKQFGNEGDSVATQVENYMLKIGLTPKEIATIREMLLEPVDAPTTEPSE